MNARSGCARADAGPPVVPWVGPTATLRFAVGVLACLGTLEADAARPELVDPLGVWSCIVYDDPVRGDERIVVSLREDDAVYMAIQSDNTLSRWRRASDWSIDGTVLRFVDGQSGRGFVADLERRSLSGTWTSEFGEGGWWCWSRGGTGAEPIELAKSPAEFFVPKLVPHLMVSPVYPRQAIREAREGRVVACFLVDSSGTVVDPELVEVSHEIFIEPTLRVLARSKFNPLDADGAARSGCRTYTYELRANY
jgi:Gram-negative bacterial TonB protein C-terminal